MPGGEINTWARPTPAVAVGPVAADAGGVCAATDGLGLGVAGGAAGGATGGDAGIGAAGG